MKSDAAAMGSYDPSSPEKDFDYHFIRFRHEILGRFLRGESALELGCATGLSTALLASRVRSVVTVEVDGNNIEAAKRFLEKEQLSEKVTFIQGDWRDIGSLVSGPFDDVVWFGGIECMEIKAARGVLSDLRRVLAGGGKLHVSATNRLSMNRRLGLQMGLIRDLDEFSGRDMFFKKRWLADRERLMAIIEEAGYNIVRFEPYFLKPFPNSIMQTLPADVIEGLFSLGRELPDYCTEIYVCAEKAQ